MNITDPQSRFHYPLLYILTGAILLVIGMALRISWYPIMTSDYTYFVSVWFSTLATHPWLSAFAQPFSDYAPLSLYLLKLLTFIPASSLVLTKSLSFLFDVALSVIAVALAHDRSRRGYGVPQLFLICAFFLSIPTVMINSSLWGQSDALYAAPILLCLYYMLGGRPASAAIAFGLAISIKVQAIFFLPVLLGYLWGVRSTRLYLLIPPAIFAASVIPAMLAGGDIWYWPLIYLKQSKEYPYLSVSAASIFAYLNDVASSSLLQTVLFWAGIGFAFTWAAIVAFLARSIRYMRPRAVILLSLSSVLIIPYLLPRMHERYFYLADIIACAYVLLAPRRWYLALLIVCASLLSYIPYLSSQVRAWADLAVDLRIPATLFLFAIGLVLLWLRAAIMPRTVVPAEPQRASDDAALV